MRLLLTSLIALSFAAPSLAQPAGSPTDPNEAAHCAIATGFMRTVFVDHQVEKAFLAYTSPDFVEHTERFKRRPRADIIKALGAFQSGPKPSTFAPVSCRAQDGMTTVHSDNGDTDIFLVKGDRIVEHWDGTAHK